MDLPIKILREAIDAVPAVRYALAIAGFAAAVAIIAGFQMDPRIAVFGTIIVIALAFVLIVLTALVAHAGPGMVPIALTGAWAFLILTVATCLLLLTSYFFAWPRTLTAYLPGDWDESNIANPVVPLVLDVPSRKIEFTVPHTAGEDPSFAISWIHFESDVHFGLKDGNVSIQAWASFQEASPTGNHEDIGGSAFTRTYSSELLSPAEAAQLTPTAKLPPRGAVSKADVTQFARSANIAAPETDNFVREYSYTFTEGASEQAVIITTRPIQIQLRGNDSAN